MVTQTPRTRIVENTILVFYINPRWCAASYDRPDERAYAATPDEAVRALRNGQTTQAREPVKLFELAPWR